MVRLGPTSYTIVGVVKDVLMQSPYAPISPTIFYVLTEPGNFVIIKIDPGASASQAVKKIQSVFERYNPAAPFIFTFADEDFAKKFGNEERIARLATIFATLAIVISCLGLFGLSAFMAERRTKEIGIRKVLGATVYVLWRMLSGEFVLLVVVSCCIAIPITWHFLYKWLLQFDYRISISWMVFLSVAVGALTLALLTVSFQAIRAALANPVTSLRSE
jgi:ABC-type antimicrobial peptide transport system permease subunit